MMKQLGLCLAIPYLAAANAGEYQLTHTAKNHDLDNTHNFSGDSRFLCYDTRGLAGPGIENCQSIEKVEIATGDETVLYAVGDSILGTDAAPGVGAPYFCVSENRVSFIHGPLVGDVPERGYYAKSNRNGAEVVADGSGKLTWLDRRDVATDRDTLPGAHRGGTHDHEYALEGPRIGLTYDDALMHEYDRTIGYLERHPKAPEGAACYFALIVPTVPKGAAKPGEIERAWGDNWVDRNGTQRAFIGKVRAADGVAYEQSLFVADIPADIDITTADSGSATRFPRPPAGIRIRRLTHSFAEGIVRCHPETKRIAYYGGPADGPWQLFVVHADGAEDHADPAMRPIQVTHLEAGVTGGVRWHPSGEALAYIADNGVAVTCVKEGPDFGKTVYLTPHGDAPERLNLVWSYDGKYLAFNKRVPTQDSAGALVKTFDGDDLAQIFLLAYDGPFGMDR